MASPSSDEEEDWEEQVAEEQSSDERDWEQLAAPDRALPSELVLRDVTLRMGPGGGGGGGADGGGASEKGRRKRKRGSEPTTHAQRTDAILAHRMHALCLAAHARATNGWANDSALQAAARALCAQQQQQQQQQQQ